MTILNKLHMGMIGLLLVLLQLAGCQTLPPPVPARPGLAQNQIDMLQEQGFRETDEGWELSFADKLLFDVDAHLLTEKSQAGVEKIGKALQSVGIEHLRVDGHTDASGSEAYNNKLSLARAEAVADSLSRIGINRANIVVRGMGKQNPVTDNVTASGRAENRRVAIIVSAP